MDFMTHSEIIAEDFETMKSMLDRIHEVSKKHLNKIEVHQYIKPLKSMIYEAWHDTITNGITFIEVHDSIESIAQSDSCTPFPPQP